MCGIIGILGDLKTPDLNWVDIAINKLSHRGPDSFGKWVDLQKNIILGHRRLSIIDKSNDSHQPYIYDDGKLIIVYNGEIYNYIELREKLKNVGFIFKTSGDTEVLIASYKYWGEDCLKYLNGMWSFAIYDQRNGTEDEKLFIARDRTGEKPLYYRHCKARFEFASELKGIKLNGDINLNSLNHYLALGYIPGELCIANGVNKLPAAHAGIFYRKNGSFKKWRYWNLPMYESYDSSYSLNELAEESWELLKESVKLRLRSDVPVGIFLSGGLDSSLITAAASQVSNKQIKTFTMSLPKNSLDESKHAELISKTFNTDHYTLPIENPALEILDKICDFIDEPIADSSIIPSFLVSRLTQKHVSVVLGGDGGDELFGGYQHYQTTLRKMFFLGWVPDVFFKHISSFASLLTVGTKGRNFLTSLLGGPSQSTIWGTPYFDINLRKKLFKPEVFEILKNDIDLPEKRSLELFKNGLNIIDKLTRMDYQQNLTDNFLVKVDRTSMANSLEVRTPYLDIKIIEHAFKKISNIHKVTLTNKRKLQNLMAKKYLPKDFVLNRKQGFSIPLNNWMKKISLDEVFSCDYKNYFNEHFIEMLINGQSKGKTNGSRLFCLLMLNKIKYN